jgi:hypothetical protein
MTDRPTEPIPPRPEDWRPKGPLRFWLPDFEADVAEADLNEAQAYRYLKLLWFMWRSGGWVSPAQLKRHFGANWKRDLRPIFTPHAIKSLNLLTEGKPSVNGGKTEGNLSERLWSQKRILYDLDKQWRNANRKASSEARSNASSNRVSTSTSPNSKKEPPSEDAIASVSTPAKANRNGKDPEPETARVKVWKNIPWLTDRYFGGNANKTRQLVGRWCKDFGEESVARALEDAAKDPPVNIASWMKRAGDTPRSMVDIVDEMMNEGG